MLCGNLYRLELYGFPSIYVFVNTVSNTKRLRLNEKSSTLWCKCLGHISKQRMKRLVKNEILPYFDTCVDCIKGKLTANIRNVKADKCIELLGVIHIAICGSFTSLAMGGHKYFITFIDDFSRYGFIELIRAKFESLEAFKVFKIKVELQQGKKIKVVHCDKGSEYYGGYDESECKTRQNSNFLKKAKIVISVKIRNFFRSWMTKQTSPLESSRKI